MSERFRQPESIDDDAVPKSNRGTFAGAAGKDGSLHSWTRSEPAILPVGATDTSK